MLGVKGAASAADIAELASEVNRQDLLGIMVWYASVQNGFKYAVSWDASGSEDSETAYVEALKTITKKT